MNLTRNNWTGGWNPANDPINGNVTQPLMMENLCLDKDGALSLVKGTKVVSGPYEDFPIALFSTHAENTKFRYTALNNGKIFRQDMNTSLNEEICRGGGNFCVFGTGWGETFICTPGHRFKDNITEVRGLGLPKPNDRPDVTRVEQQGIYIANTWSNWTCFEGSGFVASTYVQALSAADTNRIVFQIANLNTDTTAFTEGRSENMDDDMFLMSIRTSDSQLTDWVRIEFWLDDNGLEQFYTDWKMEDFTLEQAESSQFSQGIDSWTTLSRRRGDFKRSSTRGITNRLNVDKWWYNIKTIRVIFQGNAAITGVATDLQFRGGAKGQLTGVYQYVAVNVYNSGRYVSKGPVSDPSDPIPITNGHYEIVAPTPDYYAQTGNEVWIYRRSTYTEEFKDYPLGTLDKYYRVLVITQDQFGTAISDDMDDLTAIAQEPLNEFLMSVIDIPEDPYGILEPVYDRILYMGLFSVFISDIMNPDSIDIRYTIKVGGAQGEKNLFLTKLSEGVLLLATTRDFYLITGDFTPLPDGSLNISTKSIGEAHPSISHQFAAEGGAIFYMAADGWRSTNGSYSTLISAGLNNFFTDATVVNYSGISILPDGRGDYTMTIGKGRLFTTAPLKNGERMTFVYDLKKGYWYTYITDPIVLYTEEDGTVLAGYGWGSGTYIREIYTGTLLDETTGQRIYFQTVADDNQQPRNRKESFTFKITMDTGNNPVDIYVIKDGTTYPLGKYQFNEIEEKIIDIAQIVGIGFRFSIIIIGYALTTCRIINYTFEYDAYPEQLTSLRIPYDNLNTSSRKRFINYPLVIHTLGNNVTLTPYIDGAAKATSLINLDRKGTHIHYFTEDTVGLDIGGYLSGGPFEYYGINTNEIVSEKLPVPTKYLLIPSNDYGNPNRKRHSSYKFQINTRGYQVRFTPIIDGVSYPSLDFSTTTKRTVPYYFLVDTIGIDIGGILESLVDEEFEFYGAITPQHLEVLPDMLKEYRSPETNFGVAAPKRIRTLPLEINTNGYDVTITPIVDKIPQLSSVLNSNSKGTVFHYFESDIFGTDFAVEIKGSNYFEFYQMLKPESVEVLPVAKKFDQIGPFRFDTIGKLLTIRLRLIPTATEDLKIKILSETESTSPNSTSSNGIHTVYQKVIGGKDDVYEINLPKTILGTIFRIELGPTAQPFHRYDLDVRVNTSGKTQVVSWNKINANNS